MQSFGQALGVMEIFFGPAWPHATRLAYAQFLSEAGFGYFLYGPKEDKFLRKQWTCDWPKSYLKTLRELADEYHDRGLRFGVVLSPFGLNEEISAASRNIIREKTELLISVGIDLLGIFFDDMPSFEGLAKRQIEIVNGVQLQSKIPVVFCPTFYSHDPILDKVFGQRPAHYLQDLGQNIAPEVQILWTGPKVISDTIPASHLEETGFILKRKPFICDNLFANDGPKNYKFIKLNTPAGRTQSALSHASHWAFNPMNQPEISKIALVAAKKALLEDQEGRKALENAIQSSCSTDLASWLNANLDSLRCRGLDKISESEKQNWQKQLQTFNDLAARELQDWLNGKYTVGNECLT